ncbi:MAG: class B sortase [Oscillospiraceae bacterium]|nr:class B sortase [Oscillospiraceae bacterium]
MKKKNKIITAISSLVLLIGIALGIFFIRNNQDESKNTVPSVNIDELSIKEESVTEPPPEEPVELVDVAEAYGYNPSPNGITQKTKNFLHINKDITGWIKIDGTYVDYPFVSEPKELVSLGEEEYTPNSYYLHRGLDREYLYEGTLFQDYRNVFDSDEDKQSENIVIYGHNMNNDTMFGSLSYYRQDYGFYADNPIIQLNSNYRDYQYIIFGFIITSGNYQDTDFHYWNMEELDTEDEFNYYVDTIKKNSLVDTGVDVKYGDKLLTLSTCYRDYDNSRFIIVARRLHDGETSMENIGRTEAYIEEHRQEPETDTNQ